MQRGKEKAKTDSQERTKSFVFDKHIFRIFNNFFHQYLEDSTWILFYLSFCQLFSRVQIPRSVKALSTTQTFLPFIWFSCQLSSQHKKHEIELRCEEVVKESLRFNKVIDIGDMMMENFSLSANRCGKRRNFSAYLTLVLRILTSFSSIISLRTQS